MCLIIHREPNLQKPKRTPFIDWRILDDNKWMNPDGFGVAWRNGGLHHTKFGPDNYSDFEKLLLDVDASNVTEYVAHFRTATQGPPCLELSHPYTYNDPVEGEVLVFHNGIIDIKADKNESDTQVFVERILTQLPSRWWAIPAYVFIIENAIGWSRLVIMTERETIRLDSGTNWRKIGGIWYSTNPYSSYYTVSSGKGKDPEREYWAKQERDSYLDDKEEDNLIAQPSILIPSNGWIENGHVLLPIGGSEEQESEDLITGLVTCENCDTTGTYWIVGATPFFSVPHMKDGGLVLLPDRTPAVG